MYLVVKGHWPRARRVHRAFRSGSDGGGTRGRVTTCPGSAASP